MKPHRAALALAAALILLALLAWISTFLYWHVRITRSIRVRESQRLVNGNITEPLRDAAQFLMDAEARSIPYLLQELDDSKHVEFLNCASYLISRQSLRCAGGEDVDYGRRMMGWAIFANTPPDARRQKIEGMRAWWKEHGTNCHPWWRVWSAKCE